MVPAVSVKGGSFFSLNFKNTVVVIVATAALAYFVKNLSDWQGKVSWGSNSPGAGLVGKSIFLFRKLLCGLTYREMSNKEIHDRLAQIAVPGKEWAIVSFGDTKPLLSVCEPPRTQKGKNDFVELLQGSSAKTIINLIDIDSDHFNYVKHESITDNGWGLCGSREYMFKNSQDSKLIQVCFWKDEKPLGDDEKSNLSHWVKTVMKEVNADNSVFVHSHRGSGKTAVFISMVMFIYRRKQYDKFTDADLRQAMAEILEWIVKSGCCSAPNQIQIDMLLDQKLLQSLIAVNL